MIVIDTQALVWMVEADSRLGQRAVATIDRERTREGAGVAPISVWEIAMLVDKQRLVLGRSLESWFNSLLAAPGFALTPLTAAMGIDAGTLPGDIHGDPADRMIIATARALGCPVLTADQKILDYAAAGHVEVLDARR